MVNGNFKCIGTPQHIKSKYGKGFEIEVKLKVMKKAEIDELKKKLNIEGVMSVTKNDYERACEAIGMK